VTTGLQRVKSVTKINQLMLYREIIAVCSQIHRKHTNTLCGQNAEFLMLNLVVNIVTAGLWKSGYFEIRYDVRKYELRRNAPVTAF
jgi:hypothetical protein